MFPEIITPQDVDHCAQKLFGSGPVEHPKLLHVTALWENDKGELRSILINRYAPKSEADRFALNLARARAEGVITTGKILREEPNLVHEKPGTSSVPEAFLTWRESYLGHREPPWLLVLTRGRDLDFGHPIFKSWVRPIVMTSDRSAARYLASAPVPVIASQEPSVLEAIIHLQKTRVCRMVSIETGVNSSQGLYAPELMIDELMLSVYRGAIHEKAIGAPFSTLKELNRQFAHCSEGQAPKNESDWSFYRLRRK